MQFETPMNPTTSALNIDSNAFRSRYINSDTRELALYVPSANCSKCISKIENQLRHMNSVESARLNLGNKVLSVKLDNKGSLHDVLNALNAIGYSADPLLANDNSQATLQKKLRTEKLRLGVAAAVAGNIMIFSLAQYTGASETLFDLSFGSISFFLFLPVLFFSAQPFYFHFWEQLKRRRLSIDATVTMAIVIGTLFSLHNLIKGNGETYFDSLAALVFLLLAARAWQSKIQAQLQQLTNASQFLQIFSVQVWNEKKALYEVIPFQDLKAGHQIRVSRGDKIPADAEVLSDKIEVNQSIWTGEFQPVTFSKSQTILAGAQLVSQVAEIKAVKVGNDTRLGQMISQLEEIRSNKSQFQNWVDRVGEVFVILVLTLAAAAAVIFWQSNPAEAVQRALALSLLACPCALAIAAPLVFSLALNEAESRGIVIKSGDVFEKLGKIRNVIFDKTGTLTEGRPQIRPLQSLNEKEALALWHLEKDSQHPYGRAVANHFSHFSHTEDPFLNREILFNGVVGKTKDHVYSIEPTAKDLASSALSFRRDQEEILTIEMSDPVRKESSTLISRLQKLGFRLHLLSGDSASSVESVSNELHFDPSLVRSRCKPEEKLSYLEGLDESLMIGDGANDTLAMAKSYVSIAVQGSMEASLKTADVYFTKQNILGVLDLLSLAQRVRRAIKLNFAISLAYNISGGILALTGNIHPLIAALLMPLSSTTLVIVSAFQFRNSKHQKVKT